MHKNIWLKLWRYIYQVKANSFNEFNKAKIKFSIKKRKKVTNCKNVERAPGAAEVCSTCCP